MIIFVCFYKTILTDDKNVNIDQSLLYGKWDEIDNMVKTGLVAPKSSSLIDHSWSVLVILFLSVFLTSNKKSLHVNFPKIINNLCRGSETEL